MQGWKAAAMARQPRLLGPPPGLPPRPLPGLTQVDQTQVVAQAVVGQVQAMLSRFEESFERHLAQVEARAPRECSRSPQYSFSSKERRSEDFSSQEDCVANTKVKVVSVVRALSPGATRTDRQIVLEKDGSDDVLTIYLGAGEAPAASRSVYPRPPVAVTEESCSRKRKREKKKKRKQRRRSPSYSSGSDLEMTQQAEKSACQGGVKEARPSSTTRSTPGAIAEAETGCLSPDELQEPTARETASPELGSAPMEFELGGGSDSRCCWTGTYVC